MTLTPSNTDVAFRDAFERGDITPDAFKHRDHLRLAFVCLCDSTVAGAVKRIRTALRGFLVRNDVDPTRYHETLTVAWLQAVRHFMDMSDGAASFDEFLEQDDRLLDPNIMLTHYSPETLFSDAARQTYVAPDLQVIPER